MGYNGMQICCYMCSVVAPYGLSQTYEESSPRFKIFFLIGNGNGKENNDITLYIII